MDYVTEIRLPLTGPKHLGLSSFLLFLAFLMDLGVGGFFGLFKFCLHKLNVSRNNGMSNSKLLLPLT